MSNRDEQRTRPPATAPVWRTIDDSLSSKARGLPTSSTAGIALGSAGARGIWPTDTQAGGTWIGAGRHGLVLAILNVNERAIDGATANGVRGKAANMEGRKSLLSRGLVIPGLIARPDTDAVLRGLEMLPLRRFAPFRLIGVNTGTSSGTSSGGATRVVSAVWDGRGLQISEVRGAALCFVSSGLGDAVVSERLSLFETFVNEHGVSAGTQDAFHAHRWADRPEISVVMSRPDARTVSVTAVDVVARSGVIDVAMAYHAIEDSCADRATA